MAIRCRCHFAVAYPRTQEPPAFLVDCVHVATTHVHCSAADVWCTGRSVRCDARPTARSLNLHFASYSDGQTKNRFGVSQYRPGEHLAMIERRQGREAAFRLMLRANEAINGKAKSIALAKR